jgi:hypothetical protein
MISAQRTVLSLLVLFSSGVGSALAAPAAPERFPFFPSLLNTATGRAVKSTDFDPPEPCQGCHEEIYRQWQGSMHSNAYVDPVFRALWRLASKETDGLTDKLCAGCHTGIGTVSEEIVKDAAGDFKVSDIAAKGVQCDFCHTIVRSTMAETPSMLPQNASIIVQPGDVKRGPYGDASSPAHAPRSPSSTPAPSFAATATTSSTRSTVSTSRTPTPSGSSRSTRRRRSSARIVT